MTRIQNKSSNRNLNLHIYFSTLFRNLETRNRIEGRPVVERRSNIPPPPPQNRGYHTREYESQKISSNQYGAPGGSRDTTPAPPPPKPQGEVVQVSQFFSLKCDH